MTTSTVSALTIESDCFAPVDPRTLLRPEPLALFVAPALAAFGFATDGPAAFARLGVPVDADGVLAACRDVLGLTLTGLPRAPERVLEESIARDERTLARWDSHPDGAERAAHYADRLVRLRDRLGAERHLGDPLEPLRFALIAAGFRLEDGSGFGAYFLLELHDALSALA